MKVLKNIHYGKVGEKWSILQRNLNRKFLPIGEKYDTEKDCKAAIAAMFKNKNKEYCGVYYRRVKKYNNKWCVCPKGVPDTNLMFDTENKCKEYIKSTKTHLLPYD